MRCTYQRTGLSGQPQGSLGSGCSHCPWPFGGSRLPNRRRSHHGQQSHYQLVSGQSSSANQILVVIPSEKFCHLPDAHTVCEGVGAVRWPDATILLEHGDIPHELVHDLRELDGVSGRAGAASGCSAAAVGHMVLVVRAVEVLSIPASEKVLVSSQVPKADM